MTYPMPVITNLTSLVLYANTITSNLFMPAMLLIIFIIALFAMIRWGTENSILTATFITTVIAILMRAGGFIADWVVVTLIIILAVVAFFKFISES